MKKIHVGFLLSYDYEKLKMSIPLVYKHSDRIFIAQDENNLTWSGNEFKVDDSFFSWLKEIDIDNKIEIYKDNFYIPHLSAIQNDTRERHMLSLKMGIGNWLIQIDSDEYVLNFEDFTKALRKYNHYLDNPKKTPVQISGFHIDIYKYLEDGILYVKDTCKVLLATNYPNYKLARQTRERVIYVDTYVLHESLARTEEELQVKLNNWGHNHELNSTFLEKWRSANSKNYKQIKDVFYLTGKQWSTLGFIKGNNIHDFTNKIHELDITELDKNFIFKKNIGQWFKYTFTKPKKQKLEFEEYFKD